MCGALVIMYKDIVGDFRSILFHVALLRANACSNTKKCESFLVFPLDEMTSITNHESQI